jgi:hypothetical protein
VLEFCEYDNGWVGPVAGGSFLDQLSVIMTVQKPRPPYTAG